MSGASATVTATPATGSTFRSWGGCDSVNGAKCTVRVVSNKTVTATFDRTPLPTTITITGPPSPDGSFQALIDVSIDIKEGIITSLIGPSGCGKTTLLRCFNRVNERYGNVRTTGEIRILDENIYQQDVSLVELRKAVGMVFQRPNPLPISVYENVVFGLRIHTPRGELKKADMDEAVEKALTEVGLWRDLRDRLATPATGLLLEQQQKLCLARLLPLKPEVILMDEPASALDVEGTKAIEELMFELRGRYTIVIVTHNMGQARRASDECIFMLLGEVVEHRRTEDLFLNPQNPKTAEYVEGRYA